MFCSCEERRKIKDLEMVSELKDKLLKGIACPEKEKAGEEIKWTSDICVFCGMVFIFGRMVSDDSPVWFICTKCGSPPRRIKQKKIDK